MESFIHQFHCWVLLITIRITGHTHRQRSLTHSHPGPILSLRSSRRARLWSPRRHGEPQTDGQLSWDGSAPTHSTLWRPWLGVIPSTYLLIYQIWGGVNPPTLPWFNPKHPFAVRKRKPSGLLPISAANRVSVCKRPVEQTRSNLQGMSQVWFNKPPGVCSTGIGTPLLCLEEWISVSGHWFDRFMTSKPQILHMGGRFCSMTGVSDAHIYFRANVSRRRAL